MVWDRLFWRGLSAHGSAWQTARGTTRFGEIPTDTDRSGRLGVSGRHWARHVQFRRGRSGEGVPSRRDSGWLGCSGGVRLRPTWLGGARPDHIGCGWAR